MELTGEEKAIIDFVNRWNGMEMFSTGAEVIEISDQLYNVDGSSDDPKINGLNWKQLLIENGINGNCYVTNVPAPSRSSHDEFSVGGHMTTNRDGSVDTTGICYLMPLCSWHNHTSRNGEAFTHTGQTMIRLSGYMEKETYLTFMARLPSEEQYSIIPISESTTGIDNLSAIKRANEKPSLLQKFTDEGHDQHFIMFKKEERDGEFYFVIDEAELP